MRDLHIIETEDSYIKNRKRRKNSHKDSRFKIQIYPGISAEFGESKSKLGSQQYHLLQMEFDKKIYKLNEVESFLRNFHVKYIKYDHKGQRVAPIYRVIGSPKSLIQKGYIVICKNTDSKRESVKTQEEYEFWKREFYNKGSLSTDENTLNKAIPLLIDKIAKSSDALKSIPHSDHRIFEELVAEIFLCFGYNVELTKKTRDGGKDVIALRKSDGKVVEKILIECKHCNDKVDIDVIRNLLGVAVCEEELPTGLIVATTSTFSADAQKLSPKAIKIELERRDYEDILKWIHDYNAIQVSKHELNAYFRSLLEV